MVIHESDGKLYYDHSLLLLKEGELGKKIDAENQNGNPAKTAGSNSNSAPVLNVAQKALLSSGFDVKSEKNLRFSLKNGENAPVLEVDWKKEGNPYYQIPWKESLHNVISDKSISHPVFVSETPDIFRKIGFTSLPMMMNPRHLRLNYYNRTDFVQKFGKMRQGEHAHALGNELEKLPAALKNPLAIVVNQTPNAKPGSIVAITDMNINGKKVVVPILIEAVSEADNQYIDSHLILTVYDSDNWIETFLTPAMEAEKKGIGILYFDEEKASKYNALSKRKGIIPTGFVHNIAQLGLNVKSQTETFQFKNWFKDSKVVDENGEPLVVYHGSSADFTEFSHKFSMRNGAADGRGFYFTSDKSKAEGYKTESGKLFEVYLRLQKPLQPNELTITKHELEKIIRAIDVDGDYISNYAEDDRGYPGKAWFDKAVKRAVDMIYESSDDNADIIAEIYSSFGQGDALAKITEATGYDGFIKDDVFVVFSPNQIKSATDNIGTFDPNNSDIRYLKDYDPNEPFVPDSDKERMITVLMGVDKNLLRDWDYATAKEYLESKLFDLDDNTAQSVLNAARTKQRQELQKQSVRKLQVELLDRDINFAQKNNLSNEIDKKSEKIIL